MVVRCPMRGNSFLSLLYLFEKGNSKKFSQYFLSKLSFYKLSWVSVDLFHALDFFLDFLLKVVFQVQVQVLIE